MFGRSQQTYTEWKLDCRVPDIVLWYNTGVGLGGGGESGLRSLNLTLYHNTRGKLDLF